MVSIAAARKAALSFPETEEKKHFDTPDFRVKNKIFATIHEDKNYMMVKLSLVDQSVFCSYDSTIIFPVPGGWGRGGATSRRAVSYTLTRPDCAAKPSQHWGNGLSC